jgi:cytochrome c5
MRRWQRLFGETNNGPICGCHHRSDAFYGGHGVVGRIYDVSRGVDEQDPEHTAHVGARRVSGAHDIAAVRCHTIALTRVIASAPTATSCVRAESPRGTFRVIYQRPVWRQCVLRAITPPLRLFRDSLAGAILPTLFCDFILDYQRVTVANTESSDRHFFNSFSLVLGILIAFAIALFVFARMIGSATQEKEVLLEPMRLKDVQKNIAPFAHVAIAGHDNSALAAPKSPVADVPTTGEQAFTKVCSACHSLGINGAPKIGDHAAWGPRIAQGKEALYTHAIEGKGTMPPRGGTTWPDATIRMAVDYIVSLNK